MSCAARKESSIHIQINMLRTPGYLTYYLAPKFMNDYMAIIRLGIHLFPPEFLFLGFSNLVHSVESLPRIC